MTVGIGRVLILLVWATVALDRVPNAPAATILVAENGRAGTDAWRLTSPARHREIEGYAASTSVNRGERIVLYVHTDESQYGIDVYRVGWYGGLGGRLVMGGLVRPGVRQPMPTPDPHTGLIECRWTDPVMIETAGADDPSDWPSGVYLAKLTARTSGAQSYIIFVVRDDARQSDYLFQSSVTTFQAYNNWGGKSLYPANSTGPPATKLSFDRPYAASAHPAAAFGVGAGDFLTTNSATPGYPASPAGWEINLVRWLEREGYDVSYSTDLDTHRDAGALLRHRVWLSVGHDEYWSWAMREHVQSARDAGVSLAFFSSNTCYWQIRLEPSGAGVPDRVLVVYKEAAARDDPYATDRDPANDYLVTGRWRDPPLARPEETLLGVMFDTEPVDGAVVIAAPPEPWVLQGTGLSDGSALSGLLGYEVDRRFGSQPNNTSVIARSPYWKGQELRFSEMTVYEAPSGALVFAAGSMQWSWGLDDFNAPALRTSRLNAAAQQLTRNVLRALKEARSEKRGVR